VKDFLHRIWTWWSGGDALMPVMFLTAVVLYAILAERTLALYGVRRHRRADELLALLREGHAGSHDGRWRAWAAQYVGLAEAEQLGRGFALCRALTACLPLLGLLGTVTGMVDTFGQLGGGGHRGGSTAQAASAGIGLALTATQYGMALAIPAMLWEWVLARRVATLAHHRELVLRQAQHQDRPSALEPA
jgi:biopolymer transport protein ExbB/TolQ